MNINLRLLYLYLFSFVGLLITIIGCIRLVDLGLKAFVFTKADYYYFAPPVPAKISGDSAEFAYDAAEQERQQRESTSSNRQREAAGAIAMIVVGLPLYAYHWRLVQKEKK